MSQSEVKTMFEGMQPASCYSWYDASYDACRTKCKVSQYCKPATLRRQKGAVAKPTPPPQPEMPEPIPEPNPQDYFVEALKGKFDVARDDAKSNESVEIFRVSKDGVLVAKVGCLKDGSNRTRVQTKQGAEVHTLDSIKAAEKVFAALV